LLSPKSKHHLISQPSSPELHEKTATNMTNIDQQLAARHGMLIRFPPGFSAAIGA
jgi:hypothetical protein